MNYLTEFKIQQLRTKNLTAAVESVAIVMGAVIINMLLPQLLLKYVYTDPSAFVEAPAIFTYLPLVTYTLALCYFVFAMVSNFLRARKASVLEQELYSSCESCGDGSCCCDDCSSEEISEEELKELEKIVDKAMKPESKKSTKKSVAKKTEKKKSAKK